MKLPTSVKAMAAVLMVSTFCLTGAAKAYDDDYDDPDPGEVFLGIIGQIAAGAIERQEARREHKEFDRYCRRLYRKCDWGERWACRKYWRQCDYE